MAVTDQVVGFQLNNRINCLLPSNPVNINSWPCCGELKAKISSRRGWRNTNSVPINSIVFTFHHADVLRPNDGLPICVQRVAWARWPKEPNAPSQGRIGRVARRGVTGPGNPMAFDHPAQRRHCCDPITNVVALGYCQICIAARHLASCVRQLCPLEDRLQLLQLLAL